MCDTKNNGNNGNGNKKYFQVLEVPPNASFQEIKNAYFHLKKLYSSESAVIIPVIEDISEEERLDILNRLDDAYAHLKDYYKVEEKEKVSASRHWPVNHNVPEFQTYNGNALKLTREVLGVALNEISLLTGVPIGHLKNIEEERLDLLPPQGYLKVFLKKHAEYLALDPKKVVEDYLTLFNMKKKGKN